MNIMYQSTASAFIGSFNMNGVGISTSDASKWLHRKSETHASAYDSDLVIISLQECPSAPSIAQSTVFGTRNTTSPVIQVMTSSSLRRDEDQVQRTIQAALSSQHILLADIAMGEPVSPSDSKEEPRWYGFIRLLIYAKQKGSERYMDLVPILAPAGRKGDNLDAYNYLPNRSPDKGAVCLFISSIKLLVCSVHLCGTNAYEIPEVDFDKIRINELNFIAEKCQTFIGDVDYDPIICGDLNFRVEFHSNSKDKTKGGTDFQAVHAVINKKDPVALQNLFLKRDRLYRFLHYLDGHCSIDSADESVFCQLGEEARMLMAVRDTLELQIIERIGIDSDTLFNPTFTFVGKNEIDSLKGSPPHICASKESRCYSKKRTPSWTDRILVSKRLIQKGLRLDACGADHTIVSSDHVPVFAVFSFQGV